MLEPSNPENIGQKKSPFSDPNKSSEDRVVAFDEVVRRDIERKRENELSEDDPDKVIQAWSPMNEKKAMKGFHYYVQRLDGKTSLWNEMIGSLKPDEIKQITGVIFRDDTIPDFYHLVPQGI